MRRRSFIAGALSAAAAIGTARAQQTRRIGPVVGALWPGKSNAPITLRVMEAFQGGLQEDGYVEGANVTTEHGYGEGVDEFRDALNRFLTIPVDIIIAMGTPAALAAKRATETIPIVAAGMADPVGDGLVSTLARPSGKLTGNTFIGPQLAPKRLQLLREVVPGVTKVAALQHPHVYSETTMQQMLDELDQGAKHGGIELEIFNAATPDEFDNAFEAMVKARSSALIIFPSPMFYVNHRRLVELAASYRLPTMYTHTEAVQAGGLICYGADIPDLSRRAAKYVAKILKGTKPGDLPVEQPTKFDLVINLKTAKSLGLTIPPSVLARADEVIE